jgi:lysophospholipase L1-like esterase
MAMMQALKPRVLAALAASVFALAGCEPRLESIGAPRPAATFLMSYVALGDGFTAGMQSGALVKRLQLDSYPAQLAARFGAPGPPDGRAMIQPLIARPGYGSIRPVRPVGALELIALSPLVVEPAPWPDSDLVSNRVRMHEAMELNREHPKPFRNLGIPGALAYDLLNATDSTSCFTALFGGAPNYLFDTVLRPSVIGNRTPVGQASDLDPEIVTLWVGSSEILLSAQAGVDSLVAYDAGTFAGLFGEIVDSLTAGGPASAKKQAAAGARVVAANLPHLASMPFFRTIPWFIVNDGREPLPHPVTGALIPLLGEDGTVLSDLESSDPDPVTVLDAGARVLLTAQTLLAEGCGVPRVILIARIMADAGVDSATAAALLPDRFPHAGEMLPGSVTLTPSEFAGLEDAVTAYNAAIEDECEARGVQVVDLAGTFDSFASGSTVIGGIELTGDFVTGGLFSLDGIHPSSVGYAIIANEWIEVINRALGTDVAPVDIGGVIDPLELVGF